MSFPYHDPPWVAAAEFVRRHHAPGETILAPDAFVWRFDHIHRYANTRIRPEARYDWAIVHNWMLHHIDELFLGAVDAEMRPVHADDVFVVWRRGGTLRHLGRFHPGVARFRRNRRDFLRRDSRYAAVAEHAGSEMGVPDRGTLFQFRSVSRRDLKRVYDQVFENGGYRFDTRRDAAYTQDLDRHTRAFLGDTAGLQILDIACGEGRVARLVGRCAGLLAVDLAEVPVRTCARNFAGRAEFRFAVMEAEALAVPDAAFDIVTFIDACEHVFDFDASLREIARVIKPGGLLLITSQNSDSLHLIVNRKLGYPEFLTSNQHLREFNVGAMTALIAAHGFAVQRRAGIVLYPYWEIPGVDEHIRKITDEDKEFADIMRVIGERVGPEYAYTFILSARKAA